MRGGPNELTKTPELWKPAPFQLVEATTLNFGAALAEPPPPFGGGSPGPFAGASAFGFRWTLPSGATVRMSSLLLFELNVIECGPIRYQVTDPPTGMLTFEGPNCVIEASWTEGLPDPARMTFVPGSVTGNGGLP